MEVNPRNVGERSVIAVKAPIFVHERMAVSR
jgi:hypothetical protein